MLLALQVEEEAMSQEVQVTLEAGKSKETHSPLQSPAGTQPRRPVINL